MSDLRLEPLDSVTLAVTLLVVQLFIEVTAIDAVLFKSIINLVDDICQPMRLTLYKIRRTHLPTKS